MANYCDRNWRDIDKQLKVLTKEKAPQLIEQYGVGT